MEAHLIEEFWKPEPRPPWRDWRTYSMLLPIVAGALGACIFFALGLAFAEIVNIRAEVRKPLVLIASFGVAIGSTLGSIGSGIEVFRKAYKKQATAWDWTSLVISIVTTVVGMIMGFASLLGATQEWSRIATIYGCIVVGGFASLDTGGDMIELGGLFGSFEDRYEAWLEEREAWRRQNGLVADQTGQELKSRIIASEQWLEDLETRLADSERKWYWRTANLADFKSILARLNGSAADLSREGAIMLLAGEELLPPSDATLARWLKVAKEK